MSEHGFPVKLIRLIRVMMDGSKSSIRFAHEVCTSFVTLDGLKQGDAHLNLLFNIAFEGEIRGSGVQIITWSNKLLAFADDIDLIGIDYRAVEKAYALKRETVGIGLTINFSKTKYMIVGGDRGRPSDVSAEVVVDGEGMCLKLLKSLSILEHL